MCVFFNAVSSVARQHPFLRLRVCVRVAVCVSCDVSVTEVTATPLLWLQLCLHLPARAEGYPWTLVYSTDKHGFSLKTLYRAMGGCDSPILLSVKDTRNQVGTRAAER